MQSERSILWPVFLQPHLLVARAKKGAPPQSEHGVSFRRVDDDVHVYATDGVMAMRVVLEGDAEAIPVGGAVVPAKAFRLLTQASGEHAAIRFSNGRVIVQVDGELHDFALIDVLPFPGDHSATFAAPESAAKRVTSARFSAGRLLRLQKALGVEWIELRQVSRGMALVLPEGEICASMGALAFWSSVDTPDEGGS